MSEPRFQKDLYDVKDRPTEVQIRRTGRRDQLSTIAGIGLALLAVQFLLGMLLNLFVSLPTSDVFSSGSPGLLPLGIHMVTGFVLLGLSISMTFTAQKLGDRRSFWAATLSSIALVVAIVAGLRFTFAGQDNAYSYLMATGFISTILAQAYLLSLRLGHSKELPRTTSMPMERDR